MDEYPPPEAEGGWRILRGDDELRAVAGLAPEAVARAAEEEHLLFAGDLWSIAVVRHGVLAAEIRAPGTLEQTRFEVHSVTKSFTSLAFGMLLDDVAAGRHASDLTLDGDAVRFIPEAFPLTDDRKHSVTLRQLLSMTAGFAGIADAVYGTVTHSGDGLFEHVLGRVPSSDNRDVARLVTDPGGRWAYSDVGFAHLALVFANAAGEELDTFVHRRLLAPIGAERAVWGRAGGGPRIGPHPVPHTGLVLSARELARSGHLLLRGGSWAGMQLVPRDWIAAATAPSQELNRNYGLGFWTNADQLLWPDLPSDAFAMIGARGNRCWVIPSLDLAIARAASGPAVLDDRYFPGRLVDAVVS